MTNNNFENWIREHGIGEVECLVPDMNGIIRGKVVPAGKFLEIERNKGLRIPTSVYLVTVTGEYPDDEADELVVLDPDVVLEPDFGTICVAPGYKQPTAFVIADALRSDGTPLDISPRYVLKRVVALYEAQGWRPVVAPEIEFYLTQVNTDPDLPLLPPAGRSGRSESAPQPYGLEAITEYEDLIEHIYAYAETAELDIDTLIHEAGAAQLEINFNHGHPVRLADQVLVFKRLVRLVALNHKVYATFMAKPMQNQPGSAMHLHQSIVDMETGENLFSNADGSNTEMFEHFIGGLQQILPQITPLFAPNVNSFRRMRPSFSAPINLQWGYDNRSCGLRVPISDRQARRVENRLPGADANPYLAIAASLIAGYVGLMGKIKPSPKVVGNAYRHARTLPRTLEEALDRFSNCIEVKQLLGDTFFRAFSLIKATELDNYQAVISSWERDHLLLKV
jgi:glutamine synthetase